MCLFRTWFALPPQWNIACVYSLFQNLKPFNYDLNNTRPITLLETVRKAFVKIVNRENSRHFSQTQVSFRIGLNFSLPHKIDYRTAISY